MVFVTEKSISPKPNFVTIRSYSNVFFMSRFLGLFPYKGFTVSTSWTVYSFVVIVATLVATTAVKYLLISQLSSMLAYTLFSMRIFSDNFCLASHLLAVIFKRDTLKSLLFHIKKHFPHNFKTPRGKSRLFCFVNIIITASTVVFLNYCMSYNGFTKIFLSLWSVEISFILTVFIVLQLIFLLELVRENLKHLTATLTPNKFILQHQVDYHDDLIDLFEHINEFYSWQVLSLGIRITGNLVMCSYLAVLPRNPEHTNFQNVCRILYRLCGSFRELITLYIISSVCSDTQEQVKVILMGTLTSITLHCHQS